MVKKKTKKFIKGGLVGVAIYITFLVLVFNACDSGSELCDLGNKIARFPFIIVDFSSTLEITFVMLIINISAYFIVGGLINVRCKKR